MRVLHLFLLAIIFSVCFSCRTAQTTGGDDGKIELTLVQVNDVYEIAPLEGGRSGGMARVATLKKQELRKNPNTLLVMSGDFVSPSVYGSLTYKGKRIRGAQMIDAMNAAGFDIVTFGNHEFDIAANELKERIDSSKFKWVSSNVLGSERFALENAVTSEPVYTYYFKTITDADGTTARIGFFGVVLPSNPAEYIKYTDPVRTAIQVYNYIKDSCDAVVAITHLAIADDKRLADSLPGLAAILGGHEHDMRFEKQNGVFITKAHANAKSAYVVKLDINKKKRKTSTSPELVYLNENVALDSTTNLTVQKWVKIANDNYTSSGFNASAIVRPNGDSLDGREGPVRSGSTNLTRTITNAMLFAAPQAQAAIFNSGSIRVDDILYAPITQYDILRTLPFGGGLRELDLKGDLLVQVLNAGLKNKGSGGWLQYGNIAFNEYLAKWTIQQIPIDADEIYRIVVPDFLITGKETNLDFFNEKNPGVVKMYPAQAAVGHLQSDIRLAVIKFLAQKK